MLDITLLTFEAVAMSLYHIMICNDNWCDLMTFEPYWGSLGQGPILELWIVCACLSELGGASL